MDLLSSYDDETSNNEQIANAKATSDTPQSEWENFEKSLEHSSAPVSSNALNSELDKLNNHQATGKLHLPKKDLVVENSDEEDESHLPPGVRKKNRCHSSSSSSSEDEETKDKAKDHSDSDTSHSDDSDASLKHAEISKKKIESKDTELSISKKEGHAKQARHSSSLSRSRSRSPQRKKRSDDRRSRSRSQNRRFSKDSRRNPRHSGYKEGTGMKERQHYNRPREVMRRRSQSRERQRSEREQRGKRSRSKEKSMRSQSRDKSKKSQSRERSQSMEKNIKRSESRERIKRSQSRDISKRSQSREISKKSQSSEVIKRSQSTEKNIKRSESRERSKRSRSRERIKRSRSREKRKRSQSRERKKRSRSKERKKRSNSKERRKRSRSKDKSRRSRSRERSRRSRSRSDRSASPRETRVMKYGDRSIKVGASFGRPPPSKPMTFKEKMRQQLIKTMEEGGDVSQAFTDKDGTVFCTQSAGTQQSAASKMAPVPLMANLVPPPPGLPAATITASEAAVQSMLALQKEATEKTGVAIPKYYNPAAINPMKYAEQVQKRKLLWSKTKDKDVNTQWNTTNLSSDHDDKSKEKFRKLMGIKQESGGTGVVGEGTLTEEQDLKQKELFEKLDKEYQFARMTTHTHRGVGLGFGASNYQPPAHDM